MQAGAVSFGEIAQTGGGGGIQTNAKAVCSFRMPRSAAHRTGQVQRPVVERLRLQNIAPIKRILLAGSPRQITFLLPRRLTEVTGDRRQRASYQKRGQLLRQDSKRDSVCN